MEKVREAQLRTKSKSSDVSRLEPRKSETSEDVEKIYMTKNKALKVFYRKALIKFLGNCGRFRATTV